jgi:uroporphyrinogen III methyltransferase/synthase
MEGGAGIVYLVGAGPGDPGLLTRRGAAVLAQADVIVYDHLASPRLLDLAPPGALRICAGKSIGHCTLTQDEINTLLIDHARQGRRVVRLKGGDPYVFGRGAEEAERLHAAGIAVQVVPGVTAAVGVTAYAGVSITHREIASAVAFITGHDDPEAPRPPDASASGSPSIAGTRLDWAALARFPGTLVVYMGVTRLPGLCRTLIRHGKPATTPAALIASGTLAAQRTVTGTLGDLAERAAEARLGPPALLVVGDVIARRPALNWFEELPLFGQRIVVTRPGDEADGSAADLEALGAEVLVAPTVMILPPADWAPVDRAIAALEHLDWLVFTSANGVRFFLDRIESNGRDLRALGRVKLAAIGPATAAALARYHLRADLVPEAYRSEDLAAALAPRVAGQRVLLARADRGRTLLLEALRPIADVEQIAVYRNTDADALPPAVLERLAAGTVDWITLTSSAITERLFALLPEEARRRIGREIRLASLSPVTSGAAARLGWTIAAEALAYTWPGLVQAIVQAVAAGRPAPEKQPSTSLTTSRSAP